MSKLISRLMSAFLDRLDKVMEAIGTVIIYLGYYCYYYGQKLALKLRVYWVFLYTGLACLINACRLYFFGTNEVIYYSLKERNPILYLHMMGIRDYGIDRTNYRPFWPMFVLIGISCIVFGIYYHYQEIEGESTENSSDE